MTQWLPKMRRGAQLALATTCVCAIAQADVTLQQKSTLDVASVIQMHGTSTTSITDDKKREDTESHCEGVMSIVCGNLQSGEIIRLDRDLTWRLEPKKKLYHEQAFASPAELAEMRAKMQANLEKMRSCPVSQKQQPIDKSQCQMSPPKIEIHKTGTKATIAGHDAELTSGSLTESCANKDTGDVCDTVIAVDLWLTQDKLPGSETRAAFNQAYAKKLGLGDAAAALHGDVAKYLAAYQSQIMELEAKAGDLKGQPLKTTLRVLVGGPQCKSVKPDAANGGSSSAGTNPLSDVTQAGKAVSSLVGGLFKKKKPDDSQAASAAPADTASPAATTPDPYAQLTRMGTFTLETVAIDTNAIPADRFDIPAGWTKEVPKPTKAGDDDFQCPKTGT